MINSRQKGAVGEREWAEACTANGYPARRGQQFMGSPDSPDVVCPSLAPLHFEVKRVQSLNVPAAFNKARVDAGCAKIPVLAHRKNGGPWLITMEAPDWWKLIRKSYPCPETTSTSDSKSCAESHPKAPDSPTATLRPLAAVLLPQS